MKRMSDTLDLAVAAGKIAEAAWFFIGCAAGFTVAVLKYRRQDMSDPKHAPHQWKFSTERWIGGLCLFFAIFIIAQNTVVTLRVESQSREQVAVAKAQAQCNQEFMRVLKERVAVTSRDAALAKSDRVATSTLMGELVKTTDPAVRQEAMRKYIDVIHANEEQRAKNDVERANNPYPDPQCR